MGIDFKAYLPKNIPNLESVDKERFILVLQTLNIRALAVSLSAVLFLYVLINAFVWLNGKSAVEHLNAQMPSIRVPVTFSETSTHLETEDFEKIRDTFLIEGLSAETSAGELPIIRQSDYLTSFRAYQTPFEYDATSKKPVLAFIVKDYGLSKQSSNMAVKSLPPEVSFMLSTYANRASQWINSAHENGHEVWLQLPIENEKMKDQGPQTIFHHFSLNDKQATIYNTLTKSLGYVGLASLTDDTFKDAKEEYSKLFDEIYNRGLGYLELNPNALPTIEGKAIAKGAPYIKADTEIVRMTGKNSFETLEQIAQDKGYALGVIPNNENTIKNLASWINKIGKVDYQIAPVSALYDLPTLKNSQNSQLRGEDLIDPDLTQR